MNIKTRENSNIPGKGGNDNFELTKEAENTIEE
jgi:hypothetical protein